MTNIDERALAFLTEPRTCTELGEHLWCSDHSIYHRNRQCYARPAGKVIKRLLDAKKIKQAWPYGWEKRAAQFIVSEGYEY